MPIAEADLCQLIQQDLADIAGSNYPAIQRTPVGFLEAVTSELNTSNIPEPIIMDSNDGHGPKTALIEFIQPATTADINTVRQNVCDDGVSRPKLRYTKAITKFVSTSNLEFTKAELRKFCEAPSVYRARRIMAEMDAFFRVVNQIGIGQYLAGYGKFYGNVSGPKEIQLLDGSHSIWASDPNGEAALMEEFKKYGFTASPFIVGAGYLERYAALQKIGCCNRYGQQINETGDWNYFYDMDVDAVAASSNNAIAFVPGTVQFVSWNENEGEFAFKHAHFDETTIVDPITGIKLDMELNYDRCTKKWNILFFLNFDFFLLPLNMRKTGDDRVGMNGSFLYTTAKSEAES